MLAPTGEPDVGSMAGAVNWDDAEIARWIRVGLIPKGAGGDQIRVIEAVIDPAGAWASGSSRVQGPCRAMVCDPPALTACQVSVPIGVGTFRLFVVPSPSWPAWLRPQARSVPSLRIAIVW